MFEGEEWDLLEEGPEEGTRSLPRKTIEFVALNGVFWRILSGNFDNLATICISVPIVDSG